MASVKVKTPSGADSGTVDLPDTLFGIEPNVPVMHQVVTAQLAARRAGTHSTLTRAEVRGGGAKPWAQKGTGRARQGSIRAPHWRGGGVAFGPKPRDYSQRTPKKMIQLALRSALSDRAAEGKVLVVDDWGFTAPRTRDAKAALEALGVDGKALVVLRPDDVVAWRSFRNLQGVHLLESSQLNAYDILCSDVVIFTKESLPGAAAEHAPSASTLARRQLATEKKAVEAAKAPAVAEPVAAVEAPKKKVVKKKIVKKVVKKKAAPVGEAPDAASGDLPPRMKPATDTDGTSEGADS
jgi:large subunit ribosomal protein L4